MSARPSVVCVRVCVCLRVVPPDGAEQPAAPPFVMRPSHASSGVWRVLPDNPRPARRVACLTELSASPRLPRGLPCTQQRHAFARGMTAPAT